MIEDNIISRRIIHDDAQITDPSQLKEGALYQKMSILGQRPSLFKFLHLNDDFETAIIEEGKVKEKLFLADYGIISYMSGWNPTNYVIPVK